MPLLFRQETSKQSPGHFAVAPLLAIALLNADCALGPKTHDDSSMRQSALGSASVLGKATGIAAGGSTCALLESGQVA